MTMFDAQLARQVEAWKKYWETVTSSDEAEHQLRRLRCLEEFAFHCGPEISRDQYRALQHEIGAGEAKLSELRGNVPKTPSLANPQVPESPCSEMAKNGAQQKLVFGAPS